jgi:lysophospholipase L1-like esterase
VETVQPPATPPAVSRRLRLAALAAVVAVVAGSGGLAACSADAGGTRSGSGPLPTTAPAVSIRSYVALGDSYSAAPFVPVTDFADGCLRSSGNFASLAAKELGAVLTDVSCSGAETKDLTGPQVIPFGGGRVPPQIDAVTQDTDLVTVSIGGNDESVFGTLVHRCTALSDHPGAPCRAALTDELGPDLPVLEVIGHRVTRSLRAVRRAAPQAEVVLVGYPRIISGTRACRAIPLAAGDRPFLAGLEARLNTSLRRAAARAGALFVDMRAASRGHEICSADPWVNGRRTDESRALAYHPFAEGEQAVARRLLAVLGRG